MNKLMMGVAVAAVAFASFAQADLPPEYVQCEYIESTGWEYIKTGILPSWSTRFVVDFQMLQATAPRDIRGRVDNPAMGGNAGSCQFNIGAQPSGENGCIARARCSTNYGNYGAYEDVNAFERTVVDLRGDGSVWANDVQRTKQTALGTNPDTSFEASGGLYLFAVNEPREKWDASFPCVMRMFGCQFYEGETLVRDFVPCFHLTSNAYGLYDTVGKRFYGNASGQGAFSGDAEIAATPLEKGEWTRFRYQSVLTFEKTTAEKPLSDIPVLVRISESRIDGFSYGDCAVNVEMGVVDLAFALSPRGTWLDYEIEKWDPSGESLVWVRIPKLTNKTQVKMYWGVKDAQDHVVPLSGASVWSANGYSTVLHMNALNGMDATGENEYTALAGVRKNDAGPVGVCLKTSAVDVLRDDGQAPWVKTLTSKSFTMSFWVSYALVSGNGTYPFMAQWGNNPSFVSNSDGFWLGASLDPNAASYGTAFWFTAHDQICPVYRTRHPEFDWEKLNYLDQWVHYAYSYEQLEDGSAHVRVFLNGEQIDEVTQELPSGVASFVTATDTDLRLMGGHASQGNSGSICMDEFRLSPVARDADYVSTAYRTMAEPDFITMSAAGKATSSTQGLIIFIY